MTDTHTCSYYCERPECVLAQRNELRDEVERLKKYLATKPDDNDASLQAQLLRRARTWAEDEGYNGAFVRVMQSASDELTRLQAENERLREQVRVLREAAEEVLNIGYRSNYCPFCGEPSTRSCYPKCQLAALGRALEALATTEEKP